MILSSSWIFFVICSGGGASWAQLFGVLVFILLFAAFQIYILWYANDYDRKKQQKDRVRQRERVGSFSATSSIAKNNRYNKKYGGRAGNNYVDNFNCNIDIIKFMIKFLSCLREYSIPIGDGLICCGCTVRNNS